MLTAILSNGTGRKMIHDAAIAGAGVGASLFSGLTTLKAILAIAVSVLMVALLALRIYNEWRRAKRQRLKDQYYGDGGGSSDES